MGKDVATISRPPRPAADTRPGRMAFATPPTRAPGMAVAAVWLVYGLVAAATVVTYWRMPPGTAYHFTDSGASGAASRLVTYLSFPVAVAAIGVAWAVCSRRAAVIVTVLCGVAIIPGVISTSDLTARWVDLPAALGALLAVPLTLRVADPAARRLSTARIVLLAGLLIWSVPWLLATLGLYAEDLPLLGNLLMSRDPTPGHPKLAAVHLGLHDGMMGAMLAATALILSSRRMPRWLSLYLSLMLVYGAALAVQDGWSEQVVKRGWSATDLPDLMQPAVGLPWRVIVLAAIGVHVLWFGRRAGGARGAS